MSVDGGHGASAPLPILRRLAGLRRWRYQPWGRVRGSARNDPFHPHIQFENALYEPVEQDRRKKSIIELAGAAAGHRIEIEAGPDKFVQLIIDDPGPLTVQTEMLLDPQR